MATCFEIICTHMLGLACKGAAILEINKPIMKTENILKWVWTNLCNKHIYKNRDCRGSVALFFVCKNISQQIFLTVQQEIRNNIFLTVQREIGNNIFLGLLLFFFLPHHDYFVSPTWTARLKCQGLINP